MNKSKRIFACFLLVLLMTPLCSCNYLDRLKAHHAVWNDEDKTGILWNGEVFRELDKESGYLYTDNINVTDADVPVLLSDAYGRTAHVDPTGNLIYFEYYVFDDAYSTRRYVRSEVYDQYKAAAEKAEMDRFCAEISIYTHEDGERAAVVKVLSAELTKRVEDAAASGSLTPLSEEETLDFYESHERVYLDPVYGSQGSMYLYRSDELMLNLQPIGSISAYTSNGGEGDIVYLVDCSDPALLSPGLDDGGQDSAYEYLLKDTGIYTDIMKELTGE